VTIVLELENIGGFVGRHRFEFVEGLNVAMAPNATGKTSLVKALLAMYAPGIASPEELLNHDANEGFIKIELDGRVYVRRFKREGGRAVEIESIPVAVDERIKHVVLDTHLGEVVRRFVLELKPDVTDYLTKVFKLDYYERRKAELKSKIEKLEKEVEHLRGEVKELDKLSEEKKKLEVEREKLERELEKLKIISVGRVQQLEQKIAGLRRKLGEIDERIKGIEERLIPETRERMDVVESEIERLERVIKEFYERYREPDKYVEGLKERIKLVDDLISAWSKELNDLVSGQDARIPVIRMAMLTKATRCPVCGAPIEKPEEFWNSKLKEAEEDVMRVKANIIRDYEERIKRVQSERQSLWKELEEFIKKYNEVREVEAVSLPKYRAQLESLKKNLEGYRREADRLRSERDEILAELEKLERELPEEERRIARRRSEIEERLGGLEQRIKNLEEAIARKGDAGRRLIEVSKEIERLKRELEVTEEEHYMLLNKLKDEFARIASEVVRELRFTWLKSIRLIEVDKRFEVRIIRVLPSGREVEQPLSTLSTSERLAVSLVTVLTGYRLKILEEYEGLIPIVADEALLAFDPYRFEKVLEELRRHAKYIIVTKLAEPREVSKLTIIHKR
jgi:DNA repair exonuclease SbcCD ATPase subunit